MRAAQITAPQHRTFISAETLEAASMAGWLISKIEKGDLIFKTDYRSVFEFALRHHLRIEQNIFSGSGVLRLQLVGNV